MLLRKRYVLSLLKFGDDREFRIHKTKDIFYKPLFMCDEEGRLLNFINPFKFKLYLAV